MKDKAYADALGIVIANYRKSNTPEMSIREFAEKSGVCKSVISELESKKHKGNICSTTLSKISIGLNLENIFKLNEIVEKCLNGELEKKDLDIEETIVLRKNTKLYELFNVVRKLDDNNIEMLHSIALKLK